MTEAKKFDGGKSRPDLLPWNEFVQLAVDHGVEATSEGLKIWWSAKPLKLELSVPVRQLPGIARVLAFGAAKYAARNWESGIVYSRLFAAAQRHAEYVAAGDLVDAESGLAHESHFWCNILFLVVFAERGRTDLDDRPDPVASVVERMNRLKALVDGLNGYDATAPEPTTKDN